MIYKVKTGYHIKPNLAQAIGNECERLEAEGRLTPQSLVDASRPEDAPLHGCFEWDDTVAAEKWRQTQAAYIIRSVEVTVEETSEPTRAFVATIKDNKREYQSIGYVLRDTNSREYLLEQAKKELLSFKRKYQNLFELSQVFDAIEGVAGSQTVMQLEAS